MGTKNYFAVRKLYLTAFPKNERFSIWQLVLMSLHRQVHFEAFYDKHDFIGLVFLAESSEAVYLMFLATVSKKRNQGYGSKILTQLKKRFASKNIVIDIEPVDEKAGNYGQRLKRLSFYEKNGFRQTSDYLVDDGGVFSILTSGSKFNVKKFSHLLKWLSFGLYKFEIK